MILLALLLSTQEVLLEDHPSFDWPFSQMVREEICERGTDSIEVFSYGSLMNRASAERTLSPSTVATRRPAVAFSLIRLFNYLFTGKRASAYWPPTHPRERGMLNVEWTGNPSDVINGVLITIPFDELKAICEREVGYSLIPVVVAPWEDRDEFSVAYTFSLPRGSPLLSDVIMPVPVYAERVREGAASFGKDFLDFYVRTTYFADRRPIK